MDVRKTKITARIVKNVLFEKIAVTLFFVGCALFLLAAFVNFTTGAFIGFIAFFVGAMMMRATLWDAIPKRNRNTIVRNLVSE